MTASDLRLSRDQESALRESTETGQWYPMTVGDRKVGEYLRRRGLFAPWGASWSTGLNGYRITPAGRDWLALHPTEVVR